ncbi:hypothetical protein Q3G72_008244 [Acer saccharum]|nr:hypothetical protein Q3G72_008244 [Acer saccharum]
MASSSSLSHPSGVGVLVIVVKLNDNNFLLWSRAVKKYLNAQSKEQYLSDVKLATDTKDYRKWVQEDTRGDKSLSEYYGVLEGLWGELNSYHHVTTNEAQIRKQREELVVVRFLSSLNPSYESAKNSILTEKELLTMKEIYACLQRLSIGTSNSYETSTLMSYGEHGRGQSFGHGQGRGRGKIGNQATMVSTALPTATLAQTADGSKTPIEGQGVVQATPTLSLPSILYVPKFPVNLLSVSQIVKELNCSVRDLGTRKTIGGGYKKNGVYYTANHSLNTTVSSKQWHYRLRHAPPCLLQQMGLPIHSNSIFECESCQLGTSLDLKLLSSDPPIPSLVVPTRTQVKPLLVYCHRNTLSTRDINKQGGTAL